MSLRQGYGSQASREGATSHIILIDDMKENRANETSRPCCSANTKQESASCCRQTASASSGALGQLDAPFADGTILTVAGCAPRVPSTLSSADKLGTFKARWGMGRMRYRVEPGLYALGNPTADSNVLVTANYKMSFDELRSHMPGRDAWILVLDTKGINVWCSAGKGTFGAGEIARRIEGVGLAAIVAHRTLILPQLSAPGVNANEVKRLSGFRVIYGPVRAADLPAFIDAGMRATADMRLVRFTLRDRAALIPVELMSGLKYALVIGLCFLVLSVLGRGGFSAGRIVDIGVPSAILFIIAFLAGVIFTPILLPYLPGRSFSAKGVWIGFALVLILFILSSTYPIPLRNWLQLSAWVLLIPAVVSFIAMNFTGASTYTSLSGVRREMHIAVPIQIAAAGMGIVLWLIGLFVATL